MFLLWVLHSQGRSLLYLKFCGCVSMDTAFEFIWRIICAAEKGPLRLYTSRPPMIPMSNLFSCVPIYNKQNIMTLLLMCSDKWINNTFPTLSPKSSDKSANSHTSSLHIKCDNHTMSLPSSHVYFSLKRKHVRVASLLRELLSGTIVVNMWVMMAESLWTMSVMRPREVWEA